MKSLKNILSKNSNFHSLNDILQESLRIDICDKVKVSVCESLRIGINDNPYTASPTTWDELKQIIEQRYEEQGPGIENNVIDFNDIDVSRIDTFFNDPGDEGLFEDTQFEYIDISDWDISNVKNMACMFFYCQKLKSVGDLSKWDVSSVENMNGMFYECKSLKSVGDISKWNVTKVEDMGDMFTNSGIINSINIPDWYEA